MTHEYKIQKIAEEKEKEERKLQKEVEAQLKEKELFANHLKNATLKIQTKQLDQLEYPQQDVRRKSLTMGKL